MPELPEVETFRRYMNATSLHQRCTGVRVLNDRPLDGLSKRRLTQTLKGRRFDKTQRHGKHLLAHLESGPWLVLHFGMTGFLVYEKGREPNRHDRVVFDFGGDYGLTYVCPRLLGRIRLTESPSHFVTNQALGPDALSFTYSDFEALLKKSHGSVKACLMNQARIAGLGNLYSDEILFQGHIGPKRRADALDETESKRLCRQMYRVLEMAVDRQADAERIPSSWLLPHRREGLTCPRCHGEIQKTKVSGRSTYWCPGCQRT